MYATRGSDGVYHLNLTHPWVGVSRYELADGFARPIADRFLTKRSIREESEEAAENWKRLFFRKLRRMRKEGA